MIDTKRLVSEFCELVSIDSISFQERKMINVLKQKLEELHGEVQEDSHGNLYAFFKGELSGNPLLFSAHMDTVGPGRSKEAVVLDNGMIVSKGDTVLGADDMAGVVAILEGIKTLKENHIPHRDIEVLFFVSEEAYIQGSQSFDYTIVKAKDAYVLDLSGAIGTASLQEPTLISFQIEVIGKASHAGFAPEAGVSAIAVASQVITKLELGRIDEETTVNIGKIQGGLATNIIPENVKIEGEIRSYDHDKALETLNQICEIFKKTTQTYEAKARQTYQIHLHAYQVSEDERVVQRFLKVCQNLEIPSVLTKTFGGSDNNSFLLNGIRGIVLACGMHNVHTTNEYTTIDDLLKSTTIVMKLMQSEDIL